MAKALPKADNAIIAEHEAGKHDVYNGGYPTKGPQPETCRDCAREAKEARDSVPVGIITGKPVRRAPRIENAKDLVAVFPPVAPKAPKVKRLAPADAPMDTIDITPIVTALAPADKPMVPFTIDKPKAASVLGPIAQQASGYATREAWMLAAVEAIRPWFTAEGETLPPVRISIGWPGGRGNKQNVLGQCWAASAVDDGIPAIFVTPSQKEPTDILRTIVHECIHAAGHMHHRMPFQKVARKFGFTNGGKTATDRAESPDLYATLDELAAALGPFPHAAVNGSNVNGAGNAADPSAPPVQATRMLKVWCDNDGYTMRATKKWLEAAVPSCPLCDMVMQVEWK